MRDQTSLFNGTRAIATGHSLFPRVPWVMERVPATRIDELRPLRIDIKHKKEQWSVAAFESRLLSVRRKALKHAIFSDPPLSPRIVIYRMVLNLFGEFFFDNFSGISIRASFQQVRRTCSYS